MSKISRVLNDYFYAWGDNDPQKKVWRYGKDISLKKLYEYDDYVYYRPRRQRAVTVIALAVLSLVGAIGYYIYKSGSCLKAKYDKRITDKKNL